MAKGRLPVGSRGSMRSDQQLDKRLLDLEAKGNAPTSREHWSCQAGDLMAPVIAVALLVPLAVGATGVATAGIEELKPSFSILLSISILSLALSALRFAQASQFPTCSNVDFLAAIALGKIVQRLSTKVGNSYLLVHMLVAQGIFTLLVGFLMWLIAAFNLLWVMRFLPYPVMIGFNCAGALLILNGGVCLGTGYNLEDLLLPFLGAAPAQAAYVSLAQTLLSAACFVLPAKLGLDGAARLLLGFALVTGAVYGFASLSGLGRDEAVRLGTFDGLGGRPWDANFQELVNHAAQIEWAAFLEVDVIILTLSYVCLISFGFILFLADLHELLPPDLPPGKKYDFTAEVRKQGQLNVLLGLIGGTPMSPSLKLWTVVKNAGTNSRAWVINLAATLIALYLFPDLCRWFGAVPKCAFSGLVVAIGYDVFLSCFRTSQRRIAPAEWRFTAATAFVTFFNVFAGIVFGVLMMMCFFLLEYSVMTGIVRKATLADVRSPGDRQPEHAALLDEQGSRVTIFWCSGYVFFGTAATIVEEIEQALDASATARAVIIDFEHVPAVDASGVHLLIGFAGRCLKKTPPISVCMCGMTRRLRGAMREAAEERCVGGPALVVDQRRIEGALGWAERLLIAEHCEKELGRRSNSSGSGAPFLPSGSSQGLAVEVVTATQALTSLGRMATPDAPIVDVKAFVGKLDLASEVLDYSSGQVLFKEGAQATSVYYVLSGSAVLSKATEEDKQLYKLPRYHLNEKKGDLFVFEERADIKIKHSRAGSLLGALEFCAMAQATDRRPCCIVSAHAGQDGCRVLRLPSDALQAAIVAQPAVGCGLLGHISRQAALDAMELLGSAQMRPFRSSSDATFLALAEARSGS